MRTIGIILATFVALFANSPIYDKGVALKKGVYTSFTSFVINETYALSDTTVVLSQIRSDSTVPQFLLRKMDVKQPLKYGAVWGYCDGTRAYVAIGNVLGSPILHPLTIRPLYSSYAAFLEYGGKGFHGIEYTSLKKATARNVGTPVLFVIDMQTGQEYLLTERFMKNLLSKGTPALAEQFKEEKKREEKLLYYLDQYIEIQRQEIEKQ